MGFRFQRRIGILPGLRLNLSKSGVSASVGRRGLWFTIGPHGTRTTVGLPGTGLSYTEQTPAARSAPGVASAGELPYARTADAERAPAQPPPTATESVARGASGVILAFAAMILLAAAAIAIFH